MSETFGIRDGKRVPGPKLTRETTGGDVSIKKTTVEETRVTCGSVTVSRKSSGSHILITVENSIMMLAIRTDELHDLVEALSQVKDLDEKV